MSFIYSKTIGINNRFKKNFCKRQSKSDFNEKYFFLDYSYPFFSSVIIMLITFLYVDIQDQNNLLIVQKIKVRN